MWYPTQQQRWHRYHRQPSTPPSTGYSRTSYNCPADEPSPSNRATPAYATVVSRSDENDPSQHYHSTRADDAYGTGTDHYVTTPTGSHRDEMSSSPASSLPYHSPNTHWNPIIAAPTRPAAIANSMRQAHRAPTTSSPSPSSTAACWDWLLYSPDVYSHLYRPSSTFAQQATRDDDLDLLASVPGWLRVVLCPSLKSTYASDDENESDQEISSLHNRSDEPSLSMKIDNKITHVSSNLSLSSESTLNEPKLTPNRSSTPDTDDGYQSASDASRSDYSQPSSASYEHHPSKPAAAPMPRRISYAAAAKPLPTPVVASKMSPGATSSAKAKYPSSALIASELVSAAGQKLKFIAPRFERMHHAKQYPSPATAPTTTGASKDSPSSSFSHRTAPRSNNSHHQRNPLPHATRRR